MKNEVLRQKPAPTHVSEFSVSIRRAENGYVVGAARCMGDMCTEWVFPTSALLAAWISRWDREREEK